MRTSYRLLSERSRVRLAPGARSESQRYTLSPDSSVANRSAKSLPKCIAIRLGLNLLIVGVLVNVVLWGMADATTFQAEPYKAPAPGSPNALMAQHDCWTGSDDMPADMAGVIPGHVVVADDEGARFGGTRLVDKALDQIFNGAEHGLTVHGFCR